MDYYNILISTIGIVLWNVWCTFVDKHLSNTVEIPSNSSVVYQDYRVSISRRYMGVGGVYSALPPPWYLYYNNIFYYLNNIMPFNAVVNSFLAL